MRYDFGLVGVVRSPAAAVDVLEKSAALIDRIRGVRCLSNPEELGR